MDTTRAEDVVDLITNVDYKSTPLLSGLAESTAYNTLHEWLTDTYSSSTDNAQIEGSAASTADLVQPVRANNIVQMFRKTIVVSDTERAVNLHGQSDPYLYQTQKKMVEMARDIEKAIMAGTRASGSSGVARRMDGVIASISTNATARTSGTSLTETEFSDIMKGVWDSGTDRSADEVYVGSYLKRVISAFTAGSTKFLSSDDKRLVNAVDVYEGDFGVHKLFLHREVPTSTLVALNSQTWRIAYLNGRRPKHTPLYKDGSSTRGMIEGELTVEALNEKASAKRSGYFVG